MNQAHRTEVLATIMPIRKESLFQFIRFAMIGVLNTLIDFSIYWMLTRNSDFFGAYIYIANTVSFAAAATFSLFANKRWTFKQADRVTRGEAAKFYATAITAFLLSTLTLYILVDTLGVYDLVAKLFATGVSIMCNFFLSKFWVFQTTSKGQAQ